MQNVIQANKLVPFLNEKFKSDLKYNDRGIMERKEVIINEITSVDETEGTVKCIITTEDVDRMGDVVLSSGVNTDQFKKIPSIFINHNYAALPIGKCLELIHKEGKIEATIKFCLDVPAIKDIFALVKFGALKGISIGFEAREVLVRGTKEFSDTIKKMGITLDDKIKRIFTAWDLYEFSICSIPANSECYTKALNDANVVIDPELYKLLGFEQKQVEVKEDVIITQKEIIDALIIITQKEIIDALIEVDKQIEVKTIDPAELKIGIEVEKEHLDVYNELKDLFGDSFTWTLDEFAEKIAKSHLIEMKDYYTRLKKMEEDAKTKSISDTPVVEDPITMECKCEVCGKKECHCIGEKCNTKDCSCGCHVVKSIKVVSEPIARSIRVIRTQEDIDEYIAKAVQARINGSLEV